jgi:hypothetical protein
LTHVAGMHGKSPLQALRIDAEAADKMVGRMHVVPPGAEVVRRTEAKDDH